MDLEGLLATGGVVLLLSVAMIAGLVLLGIWITYTIIWRAVRRGLREFNATPLAGGQQVHLHPPKTQRGPRDW